MFRITNDQMIHLTRGDVAVLEVSANKNDSEPYIFKIDDVVRLKVFEKKQCDNVILEKETVVDEECPTVDITLLGHDTKFGDIINKPVDYWYEIELNPDTNPQTIVGYDADGPKIFRIYPEGDDKE